MDSYSTGQASGMTRIPIRTMQDYIKCFRENFSETARQSSKGRRFTNADIDKLLTIQRMRSEKITDEEIKQVLTGEVPIKLAHQFNDDEIKKMAAHALETFETAQGMYKECEKVVTETERVLDQLAGENRQLQEDNKAWKDRVDKLHKWQLWIMKNNPELNPYDYKDEDQPEPIAQGEEKPRKGILEKLLGS